MIGLEQKGKKVFGNGMYLKSIKMSIFIIIKIIIPVYEVYTII